MSEESPNDRLNEAVGELLRVVEDKHHTAVKDAFYEGWSAAISRTGLGDKYNPLWVMDDWVNSDARKALY